MAREVVTLMWCDECLMSDGVQTPARPWSVTIGEGDTRPTTFAVELCDDHAKPIQELHAQLVENGRKETAQRKSKSARPATSEPTMADGSPMLSCPIPGCDWTPRTPGAGLDQHARHVHNVTGPELTGEAHMPCPEPGCDRRFMAPQGVAAHRRVAHGRVVAAD